VFFSSYVFVILFLGSRLFEVVVLFFFFNPCVFSFGLSILAFVSVIVAEIEIEMSCSRGGEPRVFRTATRRSSRVNQNSSDNSAGPSVSTDSNTYRPGSSIPTVRYVSPPQSSRPLSSRPFPHEYHRIWALPDGIATLLSDSKFHLRSWGTNLLIDNFS
jgi:hypothetical protein